MFKITAPYIFDGKRIVRNTALVLDNKGTVIALEQIVNNNLDNIKKYETGLLCPGFINAHCHLELSHLKNKIPSHTGLLNFIIEVIKKRYLTNDDEIKSVISDTLNILENQGVVAIGDICNNTITIDAKKQSKIYFHNFIEAIGFDAPVNTEKLNSIIQVYENFKHHNLKSSLVPHAPYSVSPDMFNSLQVYFKENIISIHNQECEDENNFYQFKQGGFVEFYGALNIPINFFTATKKSSIQSIFEKLNQADKIILVHNVFTSQEDINFLQQQPAHIYYCICVNANLYIQNTLPDLKKLYQAGVRFLIGTDSLASNQNLNMLSEMKTIQQNFAFCLTELLKWTCINGAEALGINNQYGSFEVGKNPGVVWIDNIEIKEEKYFLTSSSNSFRIY